MSVKINRVLPELSVYARGESHEIKIKKKKTIDQTLHSQFIYKINN